MVWSDQWFTDPTSGHLELYNVPTTHYSVHSTQYTVHNHGGVQENIKLGSF